MSDNPSLKHLSGLWHKQPQPAALSGVDRRSDYMNGARMSLEASGEFACPGCGAILSDPSLNACTYCGSAFGQTSGNITLRTWCTQDEGATWTIIERKCPGCGCQVTDSAATQCARCGYQPLPPAHVADPRPTVAIKINLPLISAGPGRVEKRSPSLVRYLDCRHWPVPPTVPRAIAQLLRPLPDKCPNCGATVFDVVMSKQQDWVVICAQCDGLPGVRADTD